MRRAAAAAVVLGVLLGTHTSGVRAAEVGCGQLVGDPSLPVARTPCEGVRPGARVNVPRGYCTMAFLFTGSDGSRYASTAGHCIIDGIGPAQTWPQGSGPVVKDASRVRIGEVVYAVSDPPQDLALIRLDAGVVASPQMCHWGRPTGINEDRSYDLLVLRHYGVGVLMAPTVPARTAIAPVHIQQNELIAAGISDAGDSGSPVISEDGRAVGVLSGYVVPVIYGSVVVERLRPMLNLAESFLGHDLELQTAPVERP